MIDYEHFKHHLEVVDLAAGYCRSQDEFDMIVGHGLWAYITQAPGFFGPCFHAHDACEDGQKASELRAVWLSPDLLPLSPEWCCSKCGDFLWMTEDQWA